MNKLLEKFLFLVISFIYYSHGERTRDKMYTPISGAFCIRRLNATHQTGCSSIRQGSVGALHAVHNEKDLEFLLNSGTSPPYIALMPPHLFIERVMSKLKDNAEERVSAVLLVNNRTSVEYFSPESKCPNQFSGISDQHCDPSDPLQSWNPFGTNLMHEDFPFPILFISEHEQIKALYDCFGKFNNFELDKQHERSLCSVELSAFMAAAVNSEVCHRRSDLSKNLSPVRFCDPLGDKNVFSSLFPRTIVNGSDDNTIGLHNEDISNSTLFEYKTEFNDYSTKYQTEDNSVVDKFNEKKSQKSSKREGTKEKVILLIARMDTTSMFDGIAPGAMDSLLSFVTVINTANMLSRLLVQNNTGQTYDKNVYYLLLNGESYDYIGSQRLLYDIENGSFPPRQDPIDVDNIEFIVEMGSMGGRAGGLVAHISQDRKDNPKITNFLKNMKDYSTQYNFNISINSSSRLPPSSVQTFTAYEKVQIPALVLTDFSDKFVNRFYHSVYDDSNNIKYSYRNISSEIDVEFNELIQLKDLNVYEPDSVQILVRNISTLLAMSLYQEITSTNYDGGLGTNPILIDELLYCYLESADCPAFHAASPPNRNRAAPLPPSRYVGVVGYPNDATIWSGRMFTLLSGTVTNKTEEECNYLPFTWIVGFNGSGSCIQSHVNYSEAVSPAFLDDNYDWSSGKYSTWTESTWRDISARMFLRPSSAHEISTLTTGLVVLFLSFVVVWFVDKRANILFQNGYPINEQEIPTHC